jgi:hypothetical protein
VVLVYLLKDDVAIYNEDEVDTYVQVVAAYLVMESEMSKIL